MTESAKFDPLGRLGMPGRHVIRENIAIQEMHEILAETPEIRESLGNHESCELSDCNRTETENFQRLIGGALTLNLPGKVEFLIKIGHREPKHRLEGAKAVRRTETLDHQETRQATLVDGGQRIAGRETRRRRRMPRSLAQSHRNPS